MSKLNISLLTLSSLLLLTGFKYFQKSSSPQNQKHQHSASTEDIWGKSRGPILVKIESQSRKNNTIEFKGLIKSQKENISTEWKLPQGAVIISGDLESSIAKMRADEIAEVSIVVDMTNAKDEPVIFSAYTVLNNERLGHSRAYKWNKTDSDIEHIEKIQLKMKDRKSKFVR